VIFMAYGKPTVAWDHLAGKAYVAFLDGQESNPTIDEAETRIFLRSAAPPFTSWTPAAAVRPWSPGSPFFEFHHGLALDPGPGSTQGHLALCWYDTVADSTDRRRCHFRAAVSRDQARRFKEMESPLSLGQSDIGAVNPITDQRLYGDYVGIRFRKGVYVPAWSANTHGGGNPDAKAEVFSVRVDIEICDDGIDNDGDNLVDCGDPDCCGPLCPPSALCPEVCDDGVDNDGDDLVDCADPDCFPTGLCPEICDDEVDNDGDELVDCDDPDCVSECP
jgi:hypothetical protein